MKYKETEKAVFLKRPNRFVAEVEIQGKRETVREKHGKFLRTPDSRGRGNPGKGIPNRKTNTTLSV